MRGESIESISSKYRVTSEALVEVNPGIDDLFYVGLELNIPESNRQIDFGNGVSNMGNSYNSNPLSEYNVEELQLDADACRYFEKQEWDKCVKTYNKLIKNYPRASYYYNRGVANLNNNKNRQAANDFRKAISMPDCTSSIEENGLDLLAEAERRHSVWKENQTNMIAGIVLGTAAVGLTTWAVVESSKLEKSQSNSNTAFSNGFMNAVNSNNLSTAIPTTYSESTDMNAVFNQIMAKTFQDAQMEEQVEYEQAKAGWYQMTGQELTIDEWRLQKAQATADMQSESYGQSNSSGSYWDEDARKERQKNILNKVTGGKCGLCKGTGKCHACGGTGVCSSFGNTYVCTSCDEKGNCKHCNGTGLASWNR